MLYVAVNENNNNNNQSISGYWTDELQYPDDIAEHFEINFNRVCDDRFRSNFSCSILMS